jgi:hypothetical protein
MRKVKIVLPSMPSIRLAAALLSVPLFLSACGNWAVRDYPHPDSVVLQQATENQALIYFLRAPHDSGSFSLQVNDKRVAELPPESYVALRLSPGSYRFVTKSAGLNFGNSDMAEALEITLNPNERVFYYVSGEDDKGVSLNGVLAIKGAGLVPLLGSESVKRNRVWKECTELDARGVITISRQVQQEL